MRRSLGYCCDDLIGCLLPPFRSTFLDTKFTALMDDIVARKVEQHKQQLKRHSLEDRPRISVTKVGVFPPSH